MSHVDLGSGQAPSLDWPGDTLGPVRSLEGRRTGPFLVAGLVIALICSAVAALPDSLLVRLMRDRILDGDQAGWAYRLLVFFASLEIIYAGYRVFRVERVEIARRQDPRTAALSSEALITSLARTAALLVTFTLVYGLTSVWLTGQRGGFWLFPLLAIAQLAWYFRSLGEIARWEGRQPAPPEWRPEPWPRAMPDYCPPIARGLRRIERLESPTGD